MSRTDARSQADHGLYEDDYRGFEPREGEEARGPLILALAIGVLMIFGAVIWNTYKQGVRGENGTLPIVFADVSPYKHAPADPGGLTAPDQNRRLYDQLDGSVRAEPVATISDSRQNEPILQGGPPIELRPGQEDDIDDVTGLPRAVNEQFERLENLENLPDAPAEEPRIRTASTITSTPLEPVSLSQGAAATVPANARFNFQSDGAFLVQIAALRTQEAANVAWGKSVTTHPTLYAGAEKRIQRADLGAKGIFYRLRVGAFSDRTMASEFCNELKKRGETCIVVSG